jgi:hypothetical protein
MPESCRFHGVRLQTKSRKPAPCETQLHRTDAIGMHGWIWPRASTPFAPVPEVISGAEDFIPVGGLRLELPWPTFTAASRLTDGLICHS